MVPDADPEAEPRPGTQIRDPNPADPDLRKGPGRVSGAVTLLIVTSPVPAGACPAIPGPVPRFFELLPLFCGAWGKRGTTGADTGGVVPEFPWLPDSCSGTVLYPVVPELPHGVRCSYTSLFEGSGG